MMDRLAKAVEKSHLDNKMHKSVSFHREFKAKQLMNAKRLRVQNITWENKKMLRRIQVNAEPLSQPFAVTSAGFLAGIPSCA